MLYVGLPLKSVWKLPLIQNATAGLLTGNDYKKHVTFLLQQLHRLPVCLWAPFKVMVIIVYKATCSLYLKDITLYEPSQLLTSAKALFTFPGSVLIIFTW